MELEKCTDRSWHVIDGETNHEYLGAIRIGGDGVWRFKASEYTEYSAFMLGEISMLVNNLNREFENEGV